jgi:hypothetical protein
MARPYGSARLRPIPESMEAEIRIEANGEPRVLRPLERAIESPLSREDALLYARVCLPEGIVELADYAVFVRHVLADIRDLP